MKSFKKVGLVLGAALLVPGMANAGDFLSAERLIS